MAHCIWAWHLCLSIESFAFGAISILQINSHVSIALVLAPALAHLLLCGMRGCLHCISLSLSRPFNHFPSQQINLSRSLLKLFTLQTIFIQFAQIDDRFSLTAHNLHEHELITFCTNILGINLKIGTHTHTHEHILSTRQNVSCIDKMWKPCKFFVSLDNF